MKFDKQELFAPHRSRREPSGVTRLLWQESHQAGVEKQPELATMPIIFKYLQIQALPDFRLDPGRIQYQW
jgi:hypothetical protein